MPDYEVESFLLFILFVLSLIGLIFGVVLGFLLSIKQRRQEKEYKAILKEISCDSQYANTNLAYIKIDKQVYTKGEKIIVSYKVPEEIMRDETDSARAWVGMYCKDAPHRKVKELASMAYHNKVGGKGKEINQTEGTIEFMAKDAGSWEIRLYDNDDFNSQNFLQAMFNDNVNRYYLVQRVYFNVEG